MESVDRRAPAGRCQQGKGRDDRGQFIAPAGLAQRLLVVPLTLILVMSCGGGGGGSAPEPVAVAPPPPAFGFNRQNAGPAAEVTLVLMELADNSAAAIVTIAGSMARDNSTELRLRCVSSTSGESALAVHDDNDGNGAISDGDTIRLQSEDCDDAIANLRLDVTAAETFGANIVSLDGNVTFAASAVTETGTVSETNGSFHLNHMAGDSATTVSLTGVTVSSQHNRGAESLDSGRLNSQVADLEYELTIDGDMQSDSLGGSFSFETNSAFSGILGEFPVSGELELDAGNSRVRVTPSAVSGRTEHADYRVAASGGGEYGDAVTVSWRDWITGTLFNWYPLILGLLIEPPEPITTDPLHAVASTYNPQGQELSLHFEWTVGEDVIVNRSRPEVLPAFLTEKGDWVEVRLTAMRADSSSMKSTSTTIRNDPPKLDVRLSPNSPVTTDDIELTYEVSDADDDEFTTSLQWRVNGEIVPGFDDVTLRADRHKKNDVVSATVTSSDGEDESSIEVSVTIEDARPRVQIANVPASVTFGDRVTFGAEVSDADEDDFSGFRFGLDYGPAGMSVDPVSGRVTWPATPPMFDRSMDVNWRIGSTGDPVEPMSGTIRVVDPNRQYPLMRTGFTVPRSLRIADFDDDGDQEILVLDHAGVYVLEWDGQNFVQSWAYPFRIGNSSVDAVATGDSDGDGRHEFFLLAGDTMARLDGIERRVVYSRTVPTGVVDILNIEVADLDNDGALEVVYIKKGNSSDPNIVVLSADDFAVLWESPQRKLGRTVRVGNVDDDAALEIVVSGGHVYDGRTFAREWSHESAASDDTTVLYDGSIGVGDIDGDGIDEVVGALDRERTDHIQAYSIARAEVLGDIGCCNRSPMFVGDIDEDGKAEVLLSHLGGDKAMFRYENEAGNFNRIFSHNPRSGTTVYAMGAGDVDGDGDVETVWAGNPPLRPTIQH